MFLKMKTQMSFPKLMEELNGNIHYQMFCDILIDPTHPLTNYKLLDDIAAELAGSLKIQELQNLLSAAWKPYMKNLDTMFTDATCYESEMRYPTDQKLLWECVEKGYELMCADSQKLGIHRPRTKYLDVEKCQPDVPQAAEAHEKSDQKDNASAAGLAGEDTEGDSEDGT